MFPNRFFTNRMFPGRYFPKNGAISVVVPVERILYISREERFESVEVDNRIKLIPIDTRVVLEE